MAPTIQDVIDRIMADIPAPRFPKTVDKFLSGDPTKPVTTVVTTFLATQRVIEQARDLGANLIISHEGIYWVHAQPEEWLPGNPVMEAKQRVIDESEMTIWRFHDGWHMTKPDGIALGMVKKLGWDEYAKPGELMLTEMVTLPEPQSVGALAEEIKGKLGLPTVKLIGDPELSVRRVGVQVGFSGAYLHFPILTGGEIDLLLCGEAHEWEACEYVRDATYQGRPIAMLSLGHAGSEDAGMWYLAEWLKEKMPGLNAVHIPVEHLYSYL